ncbi:hypothetical protein SAMN05421878_102220 [Actinobaculum suis]|uniref:Uncharacterized protein n=1 Tax=Actinobaculum suis TaxID=1657 RepID=A0A1G7AHQ6_9ACTO|nr:hypothetical protein SAMN05421878_102220 [Actinobaculum suis]
MGSDKCSTFPPCCQNPQLWLENRFAWAGAVAGHLVARAARFARTAWFAWAAQFAWAGAVAGRLVVRAACSSQATEINNKRGWEASLHLPAPLGLVLPILPVPLTLENRRLLLWRTGAAHSGELARFAGASTNFQQQPLCTLCSFHSARCRQNSLAVRGGQSGWWRWCLST